MSRFWKALGWWSLILAASFALYLRGYHQGRARGFKQGTEAMKRAIFEALDRAILAEERVR